MSIADPPKPMTVEEFLDLPDDGRERWLLRGRIYPEEPAMALRNKKHSLIEANLAHLLKNWRAGQPQPRGKVHSGDAAFLLRRNPDSYDGVDVAYVSAEMVARDDVEGTYYGEPPVLAIEILSPSDKHQDVVKKIRDYLLAGVVVWEVAPDFQRIGVHRPGQKSRTYHVGDEMEGDPYLPGFRVAVASIFED